MDPQYFRVVFDTIPVPTFIVDGDIRILDHNKAAAQLLGPNPTLVLQRRGGDAFGCINAKGHGCGQSEPCKTCVIRNSIYQAMAGGSTHRKVHMAELLREDGRTLKINLLVSATPLPPPESQQYLLILEDVSELMTLRGMLPICAQCKKVRDDQAYWHNIEHYLATHMAVDLTHGLCPTCFQEQMNAVKAIAKRMQGGATNQQ